MDERELDRAMRELAELQHGVESREQARGLGATREQLRNRLGSPDWQAVTSKVMRLVGTANTVQQRCMVAVLDAGPGAVVSHASAAALWRLPGFAPPQVQVTRPRGSTGRGCQVALVRETGRCGPITSREPRASR